MILLGAFVVLQKVAEDIGRHRFPDLDWWMRIALEIAIILPPLAVIAWILPRGAGDGISFAGLMAGAAIGMVASWAYSHFMKGNSE